MRSVCGCPIRPTSTSRYLSYRYVCCDKTVQISVFLIWLRSRSTASKLNFCFPDDKVSYAWVSLHMRHPVEDRRVQYVPGVQHGSNCFRGSRLCIWRSEPASTGPHTTAFCAWFRSCETDPCADSYQIQRNRNEPYPKFVLYFPSMFCMLICSLDAGMCFLVILTAWIACFGTDILN